MSSCCLWQEAREASLGLCSLGASLPGMGRGWYKQPRNDNNIHQGFLVFNSPIGSSGKEEAKQKKTVEYVCLPHQWGNVLHRAAKQQ